VYLARVAERPYRWGRHDCLIHAANAVDAVTGRDYAEGQRGAYRGANGAARRLMALGFDTPEALVDSLFPQKPPALAQRGDLVIDDEGVIGVCLGAEAAMVGMEEPGADRAARPRRGLMTVPRERWRKAWKV
jgi:hypothetical protein